MLKETISMPLRKAKTTNQTTASFSAKLPQAAQPSGDGVFVSGLLAGAGQNFLKLIPFGVGADNTTFSVKIYSWEYIDDGDFTKRMWVPSLLCQLLCTIDDTLVGLAGKAIVATEKFCDTIAVTYGEENVTVAKTSPADGISIASARVDIEGAQLHEFEFSTGSSATSCNAAWKYFG